MYSTIVSIFKSEYICTIFKLLYAIKHFWKGKKIGIKLTWEASQECKGKRDGKDEREYERSEGQITGN